MITEDYISFETAKLLKEKGFDEDIARVVNEEGEIDYLGSFQSSLAYLHHTWYRCPTLQMAMKWLREVHKILILVEYDCPVFSSDIYKMDDIDEYGGARHIPPTFANCKNYEQACEAAIRYCLENLI
jgi:hypothetical protein